MSETAVSLILLCSGLVGILGLVGGLFMMVIARDDQEKKLGVRIFASAFFLLFALVVFGSVYEKLSS